MRFLAIILFFLSGITSCAVLDRSPSSSELVLNDIHSKLNETQVAQLIRPQNLQQLQESIQFAKRQKLKVSISGGKHSMGGQQFGEGNFHLDMSSFNQIHHLDSEKGIVEVDSGVQWPELIEWLNENQKDVKKPWVIRQKQTGADRFSIGGALSSNIHGRGLTWKPMIQDVESFTLINADGELLNVSRSENSELFKLVIGGYGLFGVIAEVKLRLVPRERLVRHVIITESSEIAESTQRRIRDGYLYGDFQFSTDTPSENFLNRGVFSFYKPVQPEKNPEPAKKRLGEKEWAQLIVLAHTDKAKAYEIYSNFYLGTNNQRYWSDTHQLSTYMDNYHHIVDQTTKAPVAGSEMISEVYVPVRKIHRFLMQAREQFREHQVNVIYGTVRFIKKDDESFLPWAKRDYASIVFNFHVDHSAEGIDKVKTDYRRLFDLSLAYGGNFFLTYHKWATKEQILKGYPQFPEFLKLKLKYDPEEMFESNWYRHYREMFKE